MGFRFWVLGDCVSGKGVLDKILGFIMEMGTPITSFLSSRYSSTVRIFLCNLFAKL